MPAVLRYAPACARSVRAGDLQEYGTGPVPCREDQREAPASRYSARQVAATHLARMLQRQTGLPMLTLRPVLTYGPHQAESVFIPSLLRACLANRDGHRTAGDPARDLVSVDDLAKPSVRQTDPVTRLEVAAQAGRVRGLQRQVCDPSRARSLLGWEATLPIEEGPARSMAWQREARDHAPSAGR